MTRREGLGLVLSWASQWCEISEEPVVRESTEARCLLVGRPPRFVIKWFAERPGHLADRCVREFRLLEALHSAVQQQQGMVSPEPIAIDPRLNAYLMTAVPGVPLEEAATQRELDGTRVADSLLRALRAFHETAEAHYGDFHPNNVLVSEKGLALIDPGGPTPYFDGGLVAAEGDPLATDLGYWLFSVVARSPRGAIEHGLRWMRVVRLTHALLRAAGGVGEWERLRVGVGRAVKVHSRRLAMGGAKDAVLAVWVRLIAGVWLRLVRGDCSDARRIGSTARRPSS